MLLDSNNCTSLPQESGSVDKCFDGCLDFDNFADKFLIAQLDSLNLVAVLVVKSHFLHRKLKLFIESALSFRFESFFLL